MKLKEYSHKEQIHFILNIRAGLEIVFFTLKVQDCSGNVSHPESGHKIKILNFLKLFSLFNATQKSEITYCPWQGTGLDLILHVPSGPMIL